MKKKLWIIGFWEFSWFMCKHLNKYFDISVYSRRNMSEKINEVWAKQKNLEEVCNSEIIIFSIVVQHLEEVVKKCVNLIKDWTLIIDVSSVKVKPTEILKKYLPKTEIVPTHPLFWLKSWEYWIKGLNMIICDIWSKYTKNVIEFCKNELELNVMERSPEEHDLQMAYAQWLSHFIARVLTNMSIKELEQETLMYRKLLDMVDITSVDTEELFLTLETQNPYAKEIRETFLDEAIKVNDSLDKF